MPDHWSTGSGLPDQGRLWGIRAYRFVDHVLYVTYGLSELFMKVSDDEAVSGWGAGLTMRVVPPSGDRPPTWPVRLLARLGELVFQRGTPLMPGGRMDVPNGEGEVPAALAWIEDPQLGPVVGPFGQFQFVETVGMSSELIGEMRKTTTARVLNLMRASNPLLITGGPGLRW